MPLQDQLRELYLLDLQIRGLRSRLDSATKRLNAQSNKLKQLEQQATELKEQSKQTQAKASSFEHQVNDIDENIVRHREKMNAVHSNKEYSALLVEVNTLKIEKSKAEEQALQFMSQLDEINARITEIEEKINNQVNMVTQAQSEVESARNEVGDKLDELTLTREGMTGGIAFDVMSTFERLADAYDGEAMATVEEQDRRRMEYTCGGCYMSVPVERINALIMKPDEMITCPNCQRILYISQQFKASIEPKQ